MIWQIERGFSVLAELLSGEYMGSNQRFSTFKKNTKILGDLKKTTTKQQNKTKKTKQPQSGSSDPR